MAKETKDKEDDKKGKDVGWPAILGGIAAILTAIGGLGIAANKIGWIGSSSPPSADASSGTSQESSGDGSPNVNDVDGTVNITIVNQP